MESLVSILIPAYNCDPYIDKCINSILSQTYKNIEVLISDDGSTDKTKKKIEEFTDPRIKCFHNKRNIGNLKTINNLLSKASGEFITFQDADDWSDKNRISLLVVFLKNNPEIYLCGTEYRYVGFDNSLKQLKELPLDNKAIVAHIENYKTPPFCAASCMIRKKVYETLGGFREYFDKIGAADFDWHFRIIEKFKVANLPDILYFYRENPNSLTFTVTKNIKKIISHKIAFFLYQQRITSGSDALMRDNPEEIENFSRKYLSQYYNDPSLIYNKMAMSFIHKGKLVIALKNVVIGISKRPFMKKNYALLKYWFWKSFRNRKYDQDLIRQV